ncbi:SDR family oxidoreductase [Streptomyces sp. JNUCC 64]
MDPEETRERRVRTADGVELCVSGSGDPRRPTVVLVHGYPDSKEVWAEVAERLADRHGFHVVRYDVRGHGGSTAPHPLDGGFTLERLTDDFLAVVDAVSPDRPVHLVGHDWGSVQSWEFVTVARTRGRIASFTSVSGPSLDHFGHWAARRRSRPTPRGTAQLLRQSVRSWYVAALQVPGLAERVWLGPVGRWWPRYLARAERVPPGAHPARSAPSDGARGAWLYRDNVRARVRSPRPDAYAHVPVQLVVPLRDGFLHPALYDDLERWAPGLTRRVIDAGHWIPRTHPDPLSTWIADFANDHGHAHPEETPTMARTEDPTGNTAGNPPGNTSESTVGGTVEGAAEDTGESSGAAEGTAGGTMGSAAGEATARPRTPSTGAPQPSAWGPRPSARAAGTAARYGERFAGRLVLVTGAGSGIGRSTALAFAGAGARVVVVDRDGETAARTAGEALAAGARGAWSETVDVTDEHAMERLAEKVTAEHGVVDVLVNNAGVGLSGAFLDTTPEEWRRVLDVNLWGVIHGCRLFGARMAERGQGGHIVNIASAAAYLPSRSLPAYGTTKAAVLALSGSLRAELAGRGVGVTAVCPGIVRTGITGTTRFAGTTPEEEEKLRRKATRLYRLRDYPPEKVAATVLRAVVQDRAVVQVAPEAHAVRLLSRFAPGVLRTLARKGWSI